MNCPLEMNDFSAGYKIEGGRRRLTHFSFVCCQRSGSLPYKIHRKVLFVVVTLLEHWEITLL